MSTHDVATWFVSRVWQARTRRFSGPFVDVGNVCGREPPPRFGPSAAREFLGFGDDRRRATSQPRARRTGEGDVANEGVAIWFPVVADPGDCVIAPRALEEIVAIAATPAPQGVMVLATPAEAQRFPTVRLGIWLLQKKYPYKYGYRYEAWRRTVVGERSSPQPTLPPVIPSSVPHPRAASSSRWAPFLLVPSIPHP